MSTVHRACSFPCEVWVGSAPHLLGDPHQIFTEQLGEHRRPMASGRQGASDLWKMPRFNRPRALVRTAGKDLRWKIRRMADLQVIDLQRIEGVVEADADVILADDVEHMFEIPDEGFCGPAIRAQE